MYYQPLAAMTAERDHYKEMDALHIQSLGLKSEKLATMTKERDELRQHHTDKQAMCIECEQQLVVVTKERDTSIAKNQLVASLYMKSNKELADMTAERDEWKEISAVTAEQWAASQAREAKLREALEYVRKDLVLRAEMDMEDGGAILDIGHGCLQQMNAALALPQDDTALDERLKAERDVG